MNAAKQCRDDASNRDFAADWHGKYVAALRLLLSEPRAERSWGVTSKSRRLLNSSAGLERGQSGLVFATTRFARHGLSALSLPLVRQVELERVGRRVPLHKAKHIELVRCEWPEERDGRWDYTDVHNFPAAKTYLTLAVASSAHGNSFAHRLLRGFSAANVRGTSASAAVPTSRCGFVDKLKRDIAERNRMAAVETASILEDRPSQTVAFRLAAAATSIGADFARNRRDNFEAAQYYAIAAQLDPANAAAANNLGRLYCYGDADALAAGEQTLERDAIRAVYFLELAIEAGDRLTAPRNLAEVFERGLAPVKRDTERAILLLLLQYHECSTSFGRDAALDALTRLEKSWHGRLVLLRHWSLGRQVQLVTSGKYVSFRGWEQASGSVPPVKGR
jgi:hypothetical protein